MDDELDQLLAFDALDTAEKLVGQDGNAALSLGLALQMHKSAVLREELEARGDTLLSNELGRYLGIVQDLGFEPVLSLPFEGRSWDGEAPPPETFHVLAHRDGMLLAFDTFGTTAVNGAKVWYNWRPRDAEVGWSMTSSGGYHNWDPEKRTGIWAGDHDAREALRHKIQRLRDNGELLARWQKRPFLWLLHHMDTKPEGYDHNVINQARIALLPAWVQQMITPDQAA